MSDDEYTYDADADDVPPPPMPATRDQLLGGGYVIHRPPTGPSIDDAIRQSLAEYDFAEVCHIERTHRQQSATRRQSVAKVFEILQRVGKLDATVKQTADLIVPLLGLWIDGTQESFEMDAETHRGLFALLGTLRLTATEIGTLRGVFTAQHQYI